MGEVDLQSKKDEMLISIVSRHYAKQIFLLQQVQKIDNRCCWAAREGKLNYGVRKNSTFFNGHLYCSVRGCTVAVKCSVMSDPSDSPEKKVKVFVYGNGVRNHKVVVEEKVVARERMSKEQCAVCVPVILGYE